MRAAHARRSSRVRRAMIVVDRPVRDDPAAADDDEVVGGERHLAHQVARTGRRCGPRAARYFTRVRTHSTPSGSRPLTRLVEDQRRAGRRAGRRRCPSRCPMPSENPPTRRSATAREPGHLDDLVDPRGAGCRASRRARAGGCGRCDRRVHGLGLEQRADLGAAGVVLGVGAAVDGDACRPSAGRARRSCASSWTCRPRSGRGTRSPCPGWTVKVMPSTAILSP